jgi:hypothetical protein
MAEKDEKSRTGTRTKRWINALILLGVLTEEPASSSDIPSSNCDLHFATRNRFDCGWRNSLKSQGSWNGFDGENEALDGTTSQDRCEYNPQVVDSLLVPG